MVRNTYVHHSGGEWFNELIPYYTKFWEIAHTIKIQENSPKTIKDLQRFLAMPVMQS